MKNLQQNSPLLSSCDKPQSATKPPRPSGTPPLKRRGINSFLLSPFSFLLFCLIQVSVFAQTPEAVLNSCPKIPSVETLKKSAMNQCSNADDYQKQVEEVFAFEQKIDENISLVNEKINKIKQENFSALEKANELDEKAAEEYAKRITGGRSLDDLENMSEAEMIEMAMQMAGKQTANPKNVQKMAELAEEQQKLALKVADKIRQMEKETDDLKAKHEAMLKPKGKFEKIRIILKQLWDYGGEVSEKELAEINRLCAEYKSLASSYFETILPEWLKHLESQRAAHKSLKSDKERMIVINKELAQLASSSIKANLTSSAELEATVDLKLLPWESLHDELYLIKASTKFAKP